MFHDGVDASSLLTKLTFMMERKRKKASRDVCMYTSGLNRLRVGGWGGK